MGARDFDYGQSSGGVSKHQDLVPLQDVLRLVRTHIGKTGSLETKRVLGELVRALQEDIKIKRVF